MMSQEQTTANFCLCRSLFDKPNVGDNITVGAFDERSVYPAVKHSQSRPYTRNTAEFQTIALETANRQCL